MNNDGDSWETGSTKAHILNCWLGEYNVGVNPSQTYTILSHTFYFSLAHAHLTSRMHHRPRGAVAEGPTSLPLQ